eukprot:scaffold98949_cov32-Tisochrysis_lutea.AAC.8
MSVNMPTSSVHVAKPEAHFASATGDLAQPASAAAGPCPCRARSAASSPGSSSSTTSLRVADRVSRKVGK